MRRAIRTAWADAGAFSIRVSLGFGAAATVLYYLLRWVKDGDLDMEGLVVGLVVFGLIYAAVFVRSFVAFWLREPERRRRKKAKEADLQGQLDKLIERAKKDLPELIVKGPQTTALTGSMRNPQFHWWLQEVIQLLGAGGQADLARELQVDAEDDLITEEGTRAAYERRFKRLTPPPKLRVAL